MAALFSGTGSSREVANLELHSAPDCRRNLVDHRVETGDDYCLVHVAQFAERLNRTRNANLVLPELGEVLPLLILDARCTNLQAFNTPAAASISSTSVAKPSLV